MTGALTAILSEPLGAARRLRLSRLVVVEGPDRGRELSIERERVTVGRSLICDLVLADQAASGTHFEIHAVEGGFILRDLDSTNGTFCGDVQVREAWIKHGQSIRAGQTVLRFEPLEATVEIDASHAVTVGAGTAGAEDCDPAKAEPLEEKGAKVVDSPAELGERDIVFTMVAGPEDVLAVTLERTECCPAAPDRR